MFFANKHFFLTKKLPVNNKAIGITLNFKNSYASDLSDFMPLSLCNSYIKSLTKFYPTVLKWSCHISYSIVNLVFLKIRYQWIIIFLLVKFFMDFNTMGIKDFIMLNYIFKKRLLSTRISLHNKMSQKGFTSFDWLD